MKRVLLVMLFFSISCSVQSQETYLNLLLNYTPTKFNFGKDNGQLKDYRDGLRGFQGGISFQMGVSRHFSIVPELYYFRKGVALEEGNPLTVTAAKIKLNTLELPILVRTHFFGLFANIGPSLGYTMSGKVELEDSGSIEGGSTKLRFDGSGQAFKRWDTGVQLGLGKEFKLRKGKRISIEGRYHYGLTDIVEQGEAYNRYFYLNILFSKAWQNNPLGNKGN